MTSADGVNWTNAASGVGSWLQGITYADNAFIAVGDGDTLITSPDGIIWTKGATGHSETLFAVTYGNRAIVAAGDYG